MLATCFFYLSFFKCGKSSSFPHFFYGFSNSTESVVNEKCIFTLSIPETEGIITGNSVIRGDGTTCNLPGNGNSGYHRASLSGLTACGHPSSHKTMRKASFKTTNLSIHYQVSAPLDSCGFNCGFTVLNAFNSKTCVTFIDGNWTKSHDLTEPHTHYGLSWNSPDGIMLYDGKKSELVGSKKTVELPYDIK